MTAKPNELPFVPDERPPEARRAELDLEVETMKARGTLPPPPPVRADFDQEPSTLRTVLGATLERIRAQDDARRALPCVVAMYPDGVPDGYTERSPGHAELLAGTRACAAAGAEQGCEYRTVASFCPLRLLPALAETTRLNLRRAGVEDREFELIMAALTQKQPLLATDPMRVARAHLSGRRAEVALEDAAEIHPLSGEATPLRARFSGAERLVVLAGATGRGKTVAGAYAIGRRGGKYVTEYGLADPRSAGVAELKRAPGVLVIDQVGRARLDVKRTAALVLEEILDARVAAKLMTYLCCNMTYRSFAERYQKIVLERIAGAGIFVLFSGPSLRAGAKEED
jgi:hypothetical protein